VPFFLALSAEMGLTHLFHAGSRAGAHRSFSLDPAALVAQVTQAIEDAKSELRRKNA
jgi:hypothetical protein